VLRLNPVENEAAPAAWAERVMESVGRVVLGKPEQIELCLTAALAGGHLLIEDAPGVGKTSLARALASALGLSFARIQCTSDLLPSDILGVTVFDQARGSFEFREGPLFHQLVLVDELNRASPRTQSALLEAMAEGAVSLEGKPRLLPSPFLVIATQNPHEHAGTYPLPDSQLDRFLFRIALGYPPPAAERRLLQEEAPSPSTIPTLDARGAALLEGQTEAREVRLSPEVADYLARLIEATRQSEQLSTGASTRGALLLARAARARALLHGRDFVLPEDVKALLVPALGHRVSLSGGRQAWDRRGAERIIADIAERVPVP
jgi:MoxR-like ATPase